MRRRRVWLVAPVSFAPGADGAAIRNKVLGMAGALRQAGATPVVVSTRGAPAPIRRRDGIPIVALDSMGSGAIRRIGAAVALRMLVRRLGPGDRVVLYNAFPEYVPAARYLAGRGRAAVLDLEDVPLADASLRERVARWSLRCLVPLTRRRKIVASETLAAAAGLDDAVAIYGVALAQPPAPPRFRNPRLVVQLGGTLDRDTGLDLLREAVALIDAEAPGAPIDVVLTGTGAIGIAGQSRRIRVATGLDDTAYRALVARADVGLSLKLASGAFGSRTFPSKVVDIAASGMLLVSTRVSDVPRLFDDRTAVLLADETPRTLADALLWIAAHREEAIRRAAAGQAHARAIFSPAAVGRTLLDAVA